MSKKLFYPPQINTRFISFVRMLLPLYLRLEGLSIRVSANCLTTVRKLAQQPGVILLNHSDRCDPVTAFALSAAVAEPFYYLSAKELFDQDFGIRGWGMQKCGAYSVIRGYPEDEASRQLTVELIAGGRHKLLMFPEGDVSGRDDTIQPLKIDGLRNILQAQMDLLHSGSSQSVWLLPAAAFYRVENDAAQPLERTLDSLEYYLTFDGNRTPKLVHGEFRPDAPADWANLEYRLKRVISEWMSQLEFYHGAGNNSDLDPIERLYKLAQHATQSVAAMAGVAIDERVATKGSIYAALYSVRGAISRKQAEYERNANTQFASKMASKYNETAARCVRQLDRIQQLLILSSTLLQTPLSPESIWRATDRIEKEILHTQKTKGHRTVFIDAGEPIRVLDLIEDAADLKGPALREMENLVRKRMLDALKTAKLRIDHNSRTTERRNAADVEVSSNRL